MAHDLSSIDLPRTISSGLSFKLLLTCRSIIIRTLFYSTINSVNLCLFPKALSIFIIDLSRASTVCPLWLLIFVYDRWSIGAISSDSIGPHARVPVSQANQDIDCIFSFRSSVTPLKTANQLLFLELYEVCHCFFCSSCYAPTMKLGFQFVLMWQQCWRNEFQLMRGRKFWVGDKGERQNRN